MKLFFIPLAFLIAQTSAIRLHCKYVESDIYGYGCNAINLNIGSPGDRTITEVVGEHAPGKSNNDVASFSSYANNIRYLPLGISNFFSNVKLVEVAQANLDKVSAADLKQFGDKLMFLFLGENKIKKLKADSFKFNPNLRWLDLNFNQITNVEPGTFSSLEKFYRVSFINNPCYGGEAKYEGLPAVIGRIERKCQRN